MPSLNLIGPVVFALLKDKHTHKLSHL